MRRVLARAMPLAGLLRRLWWFCARPKTRGAKLLLEHRGEVLFVRHTYEHGLWGLPGGGLAPGEDAALGLAREAREELGIELAGLAFLGTVESDAEHRRDTVHVFSAGVAERPLLQPDPLEIAEVRWAPIALAPAVGPVTRLILELARR